MRGIRFLVLAHIKTEVAVPRQSLPEKAEVKKLPYGYGSFCTDEHGGAVAWAQISDPAYLCEIFRSSLRAYVLGSKSWVLLSEPVCPRISLTTLLPPALFLSFIFCMDMQTNTSNECQSITHEKEHVMVETLWILSAEKITDFPFFFPSLSR